MPVRWKSIALLAVVPALAVAAPRPRPAKKPPVKKPADPASPAPTPTPGDAEPARDVDPATVLAASPGGPPAGGSAGSAAPAVPPGPAGDAAARPADETDKPAAESADVDSLRQEYLGLRDELFRSRARAGAIASQLYSTRVQIKLTYTTARYYTPAKASIRLDGASVYEDTTGAIAGDDGVRFDGYIAPGRHLVTFRVEATGKDDDSFTSTTESQIVVKAVAGKDLLVAARARDAGDIAYAWKRSESGSYGLGIDVAVKTAKAVESAPLAAPAARGAKP